MAIPLTSESACPPAALIDGDQMSIVEQRGSDPKLVALAREAEVSKIAAVGARKGKRAEYSCAACGYGIVIYGQAPSCPMCHDVRWEHVEWRPFSQLLDNERELAAERDAIEAAARQARPFAGGALRSVTRSGARSPCR